MMARKPWIQHWMEEAQHAAQMCTCAAGRKVGVVFVRDKRVLSTGFNGPPSGYPHPMSCVRKDQGIASGEGLDKCPCAHAEMNGIANAARAGTSLIGSTLYTTTQPCAMCMPLIINVGVEEIIYEHAYHHALSEEMARYAEIPVLKYVVINKVGMVSLENSTAQNVNVDR